MALHNTKKPGIEEWLNTSNPAEAEPVPAAKSLPRLSNEIVPGSLPGASGASSD